MKKHWIELSKIKTLISLLPSEKQDGFKKDIISLIEDGFSQSKKFSSATLLYDIYLANTSDYIDLFLEYKKTGDMKRKILIRYGPLRLVDYIKSLQIRPISPNKYNGFSKDYWISKGLTDEEATVKVHHIQSANAKKRTKNSYAQHSKTLKYSNDYWINIGYSIEEAEILRLPYLSCMAQSLDGFVLRYGEEIGNKKYLAANKKRCLSLLDSMGNRRTGGYVSKESIKFFIPLYKFCRRLGIPKKDIYFGIKGSREFFIRDISKTTNTGFFYDFTIQKINLIIEYNGVMWHAREPEEWKNPFSDYQTSLISDNYKQSIAKDRGMLYNIVWSDDNKKEKMIEFKHLITKLWREYESTQL